MSEVLNKDDSTKLLGEILIKCHKTMQNYERLDNYASPCCDCGLAEDLNFELWHPSADCDYFGAGDFIIPIKPCGVLIELANQLFDKNRLYMEG